MKLISEELKGNCCGSTGEKNQLIELAEKWEERVKILESELNNSEDCVSLLQEDLEYGKENIIELAFNAGAKSGFYHENTLKAWLNYKIKAKL